MFSTDSKPAMSILDKNLYTPFVTKYTCFQQDNIYIFYNQPKTKHIHLFHTTLGH